jgi:hypothetical protein
MLQAGAARAQEIAGATYLARVGARDYFAFAVSEDGGSVVDLNLLFLGDQAFVDAAVLPIENHRFEYRNEGLTIRGTFTPGGATGAILFAGGSGSGFTTSLSLNWTATTGSPESELAAPDVPDSEESAPEATYEDELQGDRPEFEAVPGLASPELPVVQVPTPTAAPESTPTVRPAPEPSSTPLSTQTVRSPGEARTLPPGSTDQRQCYQLGQGDGEQDRTAGIGRSVRPGIVIEPGYTGPTISFLGRPGGGTGIWVTWSERGTALVSVEVVANSDSLPVCGRVYIDGYRGVPFMQRTDALER